MNLSRRITAAAAMMAFGLTQVAFAGPAIVSKEKLAKANIVRGDKTRNVAMTADKSLQGKVTNAQGVGVDAAKVVLVSGRKAVAWTITDKNGNFSIKNMRPGVYSVTYGKHVEDVRVWDNQIAPPGTEQQMQFVSTTPIVRGAGPEALGILGATTTALAAGGLIVGINAENKAEDARRLAQQALSN